MADRVLSDFDKVILGAYESALQIYRTGSGEYHKCLLAMVAELTDVDAVEMLAGACERRIENIRKYGAF